MMPMPRSYTDEQIERVRQMHAKGLNDRQIRDQTGLSSWSIWDIRKNRLGLPARRSRPDVNRNNKIHPHRDEIRRLADLKWNDSQIASQLGVNRRQLREYRVKHLQLDSVPRSEMLNRSAGRQRQEQVLGRSPADIRAEKLWSFATSLGWPEGVRYRAVQILELMVQLGRPVVRSELPQLLNVPPSKVFKSNDPQGTYLGNLISRGLVAAATKVIDPGLLTEQKAPLPKRKINLYFLTPAALQMKAAWLSRRDCHADPSTLTEERLS